MDGAKKILKGKTTGPSGVLPYIVANEVRIERQEAADGEKFEVNIPYFNPQSNKPTEIYYGVMRTNRAGIDVIVPPGGTQDVFFVQNGQPQSIELEKEGKQRQFLKDEFGIKAAKDLTKQDLNLLTISTLLSAEGIDNVMLEEPFEAAIHETHEEQGWDLQNNRDKILRIDHFTETLYSKRSFETDPPTPISQNVFAVAVDDLEGFQASRCNKIESKIKGREGIHFYEQGDFLSLSQLKAELAKADKQLKQDNSLPDIAHIEMKATQSRVEMIERIERSLITKLKQEHGIEVDTQPQTNKPAAIPIKSNFKF